MSDAPSPHDHAVLDREHDVRIVLSAGLAILGAFGLLTAIGLDGDEVGVINGALAAIAAVVMRREDRKRKTRVAEALTGGGET